jgi:hypothetical protein
MIRDLPCGPPPTARKDLDGQAHNDAIKRRYGYTVQGLRAPLDLPRVGPDAQLHARLETARHRIAEHEVTIHHLSHALALAELRILELEQELSLK